MLTYVNIANLNAIRRRPYGTAKHCNLARYRRRCPLLAGLVMEGGGFGLIGNIVIGILGAVVAGYLFPALAFQSPSPIRLFGQSPFPQLVQSSYFSSLVLSEDDGLDYLLPAPSGHGAGCAVREWKPDARAIPPRPEGYQRSHDCDEIVRERHRSEARHNADMKARKAPAMPTRAAVKSLARVPNQPRP